ncbi:unnamed protein product [Durusdinium trenchii]|uniref:Uncharacterized protein n=2 Tax=Durusdinium trenchii TaxID=1381693 RepID=A0ABP0P3S0_9DINO
MAFLDAALNPTALAALTEHFLEATIWHSPQVGGSYLKAHLLDGLHAELLLQLGAELAHRMPSALGPHRLGSIYAHKYDVEWPQPGLGVHSLPAKVALCLWTTPMAASLNKQGNGLEIFNATAEGLTGVARYAWSPRLEDDWPKQERILAQNSKSSVVPYKTNRLVLWRGERFFKTDWTSQSWRGGYKHRRIDLWFLYGDPS